MVGTARRVLHSFSLLSVGVLSLPVNVQDLGIVVVTSSGKYEKRVLRARGTWARNHQVLFVGDAALPDVERLPCEDNILNGLCCKRIEGLRLSLERFPSAKWLVSAVDDTYVFIEQLSRELRVFNPEEYVYVGAASILLACDVVGHQSGCGEAHAGGGGGFVLSRRLAEDMIKHAGVFLQTCHRDDLQVGHFLRYVFDVHMHSLPGILQDPRVIEMNTRYGELVPECPHPLPPSVYSNYDIDGPLRPLAPVDATRLAMVHSDPEIWHMFDLIPTVAAAIDVGDTLLAYMDAGGRVIVGPRYEGRNTLNMCSHRRDARLLTFSIASHSFQTIHTGAASRSRTLEWVKEKGYGGEVEALCRDGCGLYEDINTVGVAEHSEKLVAYEFDEIRAFVRLYRKHARLSNRTAKTRWLSSYVSSLEA